MKAVYAWIRKYEKNGLLGYADVSFALIEGGKGCMTIRDWPIFQNKDGGIRVNFPSYKDSDGEYRQKTFINPEIPEAKELLNNINEVVSVRYYATDDEQPRQKKAQKPQVREEKDDTVSDPDDLPLPF